MGRPGIKLTRLKESFLSSPDGYNADRENELIANYSRVLQSGLDPEVAYRSTIPLHHRKRFGQFFTPFEIARLMAEWVAAVSPSDVLDPAVGTGIFLRVLKSVIPEARVTALDIDRIALAAAQAAVRGHSNIRFVEQDFLTWGDDQFFDAAIANPPYLRHHDVFYPFDVFELVGRKNHVHCSKLSNIYVLFIFEICRRLREGGRAAVIVPGEWVNANFGNALKRFLLSRGFLHTLLYFSHISTKFEDTLTTASVLFLEKPDWNAPRQVVRTIFVNDGCPLEKVSTAIKESQQNDKEIVIQL